jgi:aminoglycoside phosphotransferase (APT) family kinase protein
MPDELSLPVEIIAWIEQITGHRVISTDRIPGGAMREGWFVDVDAPERSDRELFLRYSPQRFPEPSAFHALADEAQVIDALHRSGRVVARVIGVHPTQEAVLLNRLSGATWFYRIKDEAEQVSVAQDFIRNLAATHRLDPRELGIVALGPVKTAREHALDRIAAIRHRAEVHGVDNPLLPVTCDWLEANVPDYDGPVVLVQGDTGPGNFMYKNGKVTAVVDWELSHWGDPMDDIAWLSLRTVQDTFTHLPDRLREYAELSGHPIDVRRVWYYRLFAEATMVTMNQPRNTKEAREAAERGEGAVTDMGNALLYTQLHKRLWLEALNELMGLDLDLPEMATGDEAPDWHAYYGHIQAAIKTVSPRITDPLALQWIKGVARMGRFLQQADLDGRALEELERADIARLLDDPPASMIRAREELAAANRGGSVSDEDYVRYLWNKVQRDDHLMRTASGALHTRHWPPLVS